MANHMQWMRPEVVLDALLTQDVRVAGDIVEIGENTWAIHGAIPVDGEVILAEFDKAEEAQEVLARLAIVEEGAVALTPLDHRDAPGTTETDQPRVASNELEGI